MKTEPAILLGALQALIVLGVSFGLKLTLEQQAALLAVAAIAISIVTRQLVTPNGKAKKRKPPSTVLLVLLLAFVPACGGALGTAAKVAHVVGNALEILDGAASGAEAYFARHPSLDNEAAVVDAVELVRAAIDSDEKTKAVETYGELRELLDGLGVLSATPPDGGAETDAPEPEPFELPTDEEFEAAL